VPGLASTGAQPRLQHSCRCSIPSSTQLTVARGPRGAGAAARARTGAADAVHIFFVVVGRVEVDDEHELLDVQAARGHAGRDQHVAHVGLEVADGGLAVALVLAAVQRQARVAHLRASGQGQGWPAARTLRGLPRRRAALTGGTRHLQGSLMVNQCGASRGSANSGQTPSAAPTHSGPPAREGCTAASSLRLGRARAHALAHEQLASRS